MRTVLMFCSGKIWTCILRFPAKRKNLKTKWRAPFDKIIQSAIHFLFPKLWEITCQQLSVRWEYVAYSLDQPKVVAFVSFRNQSNSYILVRLLVSFFACNHFKVTWKSFYPSSSSFQLGKPVSWHVSVLVTTIMPRKASCSIRPHHS